MTDKTVTTSAERSVIRSHFIVFILGLLFGGMGAGAGIVGSVIAIEGIKHVFG